MRSNSGKDEARNNLHDPTLRDDENMRRGSRGAGAASSKTTGLGSNERKSGSR